MAKTKYQPIVISRETVGKAPFDDSVFEQILIYLNLRFFGKRTLYFYPNIVLVTRQPYAILLKPL